MQRIASGKLGWYRLLLTSGALGAALVLALAARSATRSGSFFTGMMLAVLALALALAVAIAVVPRLARRVDFDLLSLPISFRITRDGFIYLAVISVVSVAAFNTANNLLFLILALLLAAIIASGILARISLKDISIALQVPDHVFAGEVVALRLTLRNHKRFFPSLSLYLEGYDGKEPTWWGTFKGLKKRGPSGRKILSQGVYFPLVPAQRAISQSIIAIFPERGRYSLSGFRAFTRGPFGFFKRGRRIPAQGEILVYPRISEIDSIFHLLPLLDGQQESLRRGVGDDLYAHRKYLSGDDARFVDWKATAKVSQLMMKELTKEDERKVYLYFDNRAYAMEANFRERFEKAVSVAASIAAHFIEEGMEVEYASPTEHVASGSGRLHLYRILERLATIEPLVEDGAASDWRDIRQNEHLSEMASTKVFKLIITARPRGTFPSVVWRSSHVIYFDELA